MGCAISTVNSVIQCVSCKVIVIEQSSATLCKVNVSTLLNYHPKIKHKKRISPKNYWFTSKKKQKKVQKGLHPGRCQ